MPPKNLNPKVNREKYGLSPSATKPIPKKASEKLVTAVASAASAASAVAMTVPEKINFPFVVSFYMNKLAERMYIRPGDYTLNSKSSIPVDRKGTINITIGDSLNIKKDEEGYNVLGSGNNVVFRIPNTNQVFRITTIQTQDINDSKFQQKLADGDHPDYFVKIYDYGFLQIGPEYYPYSILELFNSDLFKAIEYNSNSRFRNRSFFNQALYDYFYGPGVGNTNFKEVVKKSLKGLLYMFQANIRHGDIKPENIALQWKLDRNGKLINMKVKIFDLDCAFECTGNETGRPFEYYQNCGTRSFRSIEISDYLFKGGKNCNYIYAEDLYEYAKSMNRVINEWHISTSIDTFINEDILKNEYYTSTFGYNIRYKQKQQMSRLFSFLENMQIFKLDPICLLSVLLNERNAKNLKQRFEDIKRQLTPEQLAQLKEVLVDNWLNPESSIQEQKTLFAEEIENQKRKNRELEEYIKQRDAEEKRRNDIIAERKRERDKVFDEILEGNVGRDAMSSGFINPNPNLLEKIGGNKKLQKTRKRKIIQIKN